MLKIFPDSKQPLIAGRIIRWIKVTDSVSIKRPARLEHVHECLRFLIEYAGARGFSNAGLHNLRLIAEEVLANIVSHAYDKERGDFEITCRPETGASLGGSLSIEFRDAGIPFSFEAPETDLSADISERPVGGLGIFIIKRLAADVRYRREGGENILTVTVRNTTVSE